MSDDPRPEENLEDEFQVLGKNLVAALRAAWDAPERKRVQEELITGLNGLGSTLKHEADNFAGSAAGQQIKNGVEQVGERLRSTETQEKVRQELLFALKTANTELQKVIDRWSARARGADTGSDRGADTGSQAESTAETSAQEKPAE
jgi:hypothetical protein